MVLMRLDFVYGRGDGSSGHPFGQTPWYVVMFDKVCVIINFSFALIVTMYLMRCSQKDHYMFIYLQLGCMLCGCVSALIVLFHEGYTFDFKNPGFYLVQGQRLFDSVTTWIYVYNILRVSLLMPTYLKFGRLHLYAHQRVIDCKLYWTNAAAVALIILDLVVTSLFQQWKFVWLAFAPIFLEGLVLVYALMLIENEIDLIRLKPYYNTRKIIFTHLVFWLSLLVVLVVWCIVAAVGFYPVQNGAKGSWVFLVSFRVIAALILAIRLGMNLIILFMLVQFSKPQGLRLFDKVVKQKFLILFEEMDYMNYETKEALRINLTRYLFRREAAVRKEAGKQLGSVNQLNINGSTFDE